MAYKLSPKSTNQIIEIERWIQSDKVLIVIKKWRAGYLIVPHEPSLPEHYSPNVGIDVNLLFELPLHNSFRGSKTFYEYQNVGLGEQELIEKIYSDSMAEGLEQLGWQNTKFECWFYGELKIEEII